jgi:hypothetical protein
METLTAEGLWLDTDGRSGMADVGLAVAGTEDGLRAVTEVYYPPQACAGVYEPCIAGRCCSGLVCASNGEAGICEPVETPY